MFTVCTLILVAAFLFATAVAPFRLKTHTSRAIEYARSYVLGNTSHAVFGSGDGKSAERMLLARAWGVTAAIISLILIFQVSAPFRDHPAGIGAMVFYLLASACLSGIAILGVAMAMSFLPAARAAALLGRFGFRAIWVMDPGSSPKGLRDSLGARVRATTKMTIIDVTGHEIIGKGPGPSGGLLYDTLSTMTSVPVQLLLLQPETQSPDPEQRRATVFQSVLAEMAISPQSYVRRIRTTLDAVQTLNENRSEDSRIEVRFYLEKPTVRAILFDESILLAPFVPRESSTASSFLEIAREAQESTLYSAFRFNCARLWVASAGKQEAAAKANGFKSVVVKREPAAVAAAR